MKPKISVIIVTFNRRPLLKSCLESILHQESYKDYEIIVIDNGSTDGTDNLVEATFKESVKYIRNSGRIPLNTCKNLGIQNASGEIIAFIDDDCIAPNNWLDTIEKSIADYDFIGGAVLPILNTRFPQWWNNSLNWLIGINPNPTGKFPPLGSNIAFKKDALKELNKENNKNSGLLPYVEDYYRVKQALKTGLSLKVIPGMLVYHHIPTERLKIKYLIKRSYAEGKAWGDYDKNIALLFISLIKLFINPVRFIVFLNINYLFLAIVNISYIFNFLNIRTNRA